VTRSTRPSYTGAPGGCQAAPPQRALRNFKRPLPCPERGLDLDVRVLPRRGLGRGPERSRARRRTSETPPTVRVARHPRRRADDGGTRAPSQQGRARGPIRGRWSTVNVPRVAAPARRGGYRAGSQPGAQRAQGLRTRVHGHDPPTAAAARTVQHVPREHPREQRHPGKPPGLASRRRRAVQRRSGLAGHPSTRDGGPPGPPLLHPWPGSGERSDHVLRNAVRSCALYTGRPQVLTGVGQRCRVHPKIKA
jgi:hypothetical protein